MRVRGSAVAALITMCACNALLEIDDAVLLRPPPEAGAPRSELTFRVVPASVTIDAARAEGTPLHVVLGEPATEPVVSVAVTAAPPGIDAEPIVLGGGAAEGDLVLRASPSMASGDYSIVVTADRGGEKKSERVAVTVVAADFGVDGVLVASDIGATTLGVGVDGTVYGVTPTELVRVVRGKTTERLRSVPRAPSPLLVATVTNDTLYYSTFDRDGDAERFSTCALPLDPTKASSFGASGCVDGVALSSVYTFEGGDLLVATEAAGELARMSPTGETRAAFPLRLGSDALQIGYVLSGDDVVVGPVEDEDGGFSPVRKVAADGAAPSTFELDPAVGLSLPACAGHGPGEVALNTGAHLVLIDGRGARVTSFGDGGYVPTAAEEAYAICSREADGGFYVATVHEEAGIGATEVSAVGAVLATSPPRAAPSAVPRIVRRGPSGHFVLLSRFDTEEAGKVHFVVRVER